MAEEAEPAAGGSQSERRQKLFQALGRLFVALGVICAASSILALPGLFATWHGGDPAEFSDVRLSFLSAALLCGGALTAVGVLTVRRLSSAFAQVGLLLLVLVGVVMVDRFLLLSYGLPLWEADAELHFRNRPSKFARWPNGRELQTNKYGHYDHDFPEKPAEDELRILALGDSVTLGHQVTRDEAFPNRLEQLLSKAENRPVQVINAGVQGYSTRQELVTFERSLRFEPDIVLIGVCLNDFTEPFTVDAELGGAGLDYHLVKQTGNAFAGYLLHETGFGRAALAAQWAETTPELEKLREAQSVEQFASRSRNDPEVAVNYDYVLVSLDRIYTLAREREIRVVVLLFPYTFQFQNGSRLTPQAAVAERAREQGIQVLDFHAILAPRLQIGQDNPYFQDASHFTPYGHEVVAREIASALAPKPTAP